MSSRCFTLEFLGSVFEQLALVQPTAITVSLVCKKWRQAALRTPSLWARYIDISADISFLYHHRLPLIGHSCAIQKLVLRAGSPAPPLLNSANNQNPSTNVLHFTDPNMNVKLAATLPSLLSRVKSLKLEVPSYSWHLLDFTFGNDTPGIGHSRDISNMESLELSRVAIDTGIPDPETPAAYRVRSIDSALKNATSPWKLRKLDLEGCILSLNVPIALGNLEELRVNFPPSGAGFTSQDVLAGLACLPRLKKLRIECYAATSTSDFHYNGPIIMNALDIFSITADINHCAQIFTSLVLPETCRSNFMVVNIEFSILSSPRGFQSVENDLIAIVEQQRRNGGSARAPFVSIHIQSELCSLMAVDADLESNIPPSFTLGLIITTQGRTSPVPGPCHLLNIFRRLARIAFDVRLGGALKSLHLDVNLGPVDASNHYLTQFDLTRVEFAYRGVQRVEMAYPGGEPYIWLA